MFLLRKRFWLTVLKVLALTYAAGLIALQLPELGYDLGSKEPVLIEGPDELKQDELPSQSFASVRGTPDLEHMVRAGRHGIVFHYFLLEEYGPRLVVRSYQRPTEEWREFTRVVGRLRPFARQPFDGTVFEAYRERFDIVIPGDSFALFREDVPELSGWQVGGVIFGSVLWIVMYYVFFLWRRRKPTAQPAPQQGAGQGPAQ